MSTTGIDALQQKQLNAQAACVVAIGLLCTCAIMSMVALNNGFYFRATALAFAALAITGFSRICWRRNRSFEAEIERVRREHRLNERKQHGLMKRSNSDVVVNESE